MDRIRRFLAIGVTFAVVISAPVARAQTSETGDDGFDENGRPDNSAVAVNTKDGADLFRLAFSIDRLMNNQTDPTNTAVAYSSCEFCKTAAIAIQFVLLTQTPNVFSPENYAIAVNDQCLSCETVALAYQIVMQTDGPVKLTKDGRKQIKDLVDQIEAFEGQDLAPAELDSRVSAVVDQMQQVMDTELQPFKQNEDQQKESEQGDQDPNDSPPPVPSASSSAGASQPPDSSSPADSSAPSTESSPAASGSPADSSAAPSSSP